MANRRLLLLGGLFLALTLALVLAPPSVGKQPDLTVYSSQPEGGKALRLWLEALGCRVVTLEEERYRVPPDVGVVVLVAPLTSVGGPAQMELERFVRAGGRLVLDASVGNQDLLRRFGVTARPVADIVRAIPATPGQLDPAITSLAVSPRLQLATHRAGLPITPLLFGEREAPGDSAPPGVPPILALRLPVDQGEVIAVAVPELLDNRHLHDDVSARLALSLIGAPLNGRAVRSVAFDELHHGFGRVRAGSIYSLLFEFAWGRAALWAGVVVLIFLLWRGRRLGRAVPVFVDRGRSLGELVTSQAALYRAGRKRLFVAESLSRQWRHTFAQAVGLPGDATDDEIAAQARAIGRDPSEALRALAGLRAAPSDRALLAHVRAAEVARATLTTGETSTVRRARQASPPLVARTVDGHAESCRGDE